MHGPLNVNYRFNSDYLPKQSKLVQRARGSVVGLAIPYALGGLGFEPR